MKRVFFLSILLTLVLAGHVSAWDLETDSPTVTGTWDYGGGTFEGPNSTTLPATCTVGQRYQDTDATSGRQSYACETTDNWVLQGDGTGGGSAIILDIEDDGGNDSTDLQEIATSNDTNQIFSETSADKLLINVSKNWPVSDTADALSSNPTDCSVGSYARGIAADGTAEGCAAAGSHGNGANCAAGEYPLGVDAAGAVESCTDATTEINTALATQDACSEITNCVPNAWDADGDIVADEISEGKISFSTACAAGNHYYLNGNDLACEADDDTQLTQEQVEDYAGALVTDGTGTHTRIAITYQDGTGDIDFVVDDMNDDVPEAGDYSNLTCTSGVECTAVTGTVNVDLVTAGSDGDSATSQSDSFLEFVGNKLTLLRGCSDNQIPKWDEAADDWNCEADATGAGGSAITLDIGDDGGNDSVDLTEIATVGDTNQIFTESATDKLLITVSNNWPTADTADALSANGANCSAGQYPLGVDASGASESCTADDDSPEAGDYATASIDGDDVNSNIAGRSLTLTAGSPDTLDADEELYAYNKGPLWFEDPVAADDFASIDHFERAVTITRIWCQSDQLVVINLQRDDGTPADMATANILCDADDGDACASGCDRTLDGAEVNLAIGEEIDLQVISVSDTPTWVSIKWFGTYDD